MNWNDWYDRLLHVPPWLLDGLGGAAAALVVVAAVHRARANAAPRDSRRTEWALTVVAALVATGVALQGMWQLFDTIGMPPVARVALCGFIEIAMTTSALRARRNLLEFGSTGADGIAVWVFAGLNAVLATLEAHTLAEHLLRLVAPFVAAWLWHRGMVGEYRKIEPRARQAVTWRITPERILVWLRLAEPGERQLAEIDRIRRRAALARWALRTHTLPEDSVRRRVSAWMLRRRGFAAVQHLGLGTDPAVIEEIRATLGAVYELVPGTSPAAVRATDPWQLVTADPEPEPDNPGPGPGGSDEVIVEVIDDEPEPEESPEGDLPEPAPEPVQPAAYAYVCKFDACDDPRHMRAREAAGTLGPVMADGHVHARPEDARPEDASTVVHDDRASDEEERAPEDDARTPNGDARTPIDRDVVYARWREAELSTDERDRWTAKRVGEECGVTAPQGSRIRKDWLVRLQGEMESTRIRLVT